MKTNPPKIIAKSPIVSIMGHVDHGKSTLLDYIRKSNVVAGESGGITQRISAYEVVHENKDGDLKKITFLDTPGHAAFTGMRIRGANVADIVILVVSAEDGVKAQTMEAYDAIIKSGTPYIVAINKIDKPGANIDRTKNTLLENGIYLEGMGGNIPWVPISAKTGEGVEDLLDLILFIAEFNEMKTDLAPKATGFVIESNRDPKRGISATLLIKEGTLKKGDFIVAGDCLVPVRIMENFLGKSITESYSSSPVQVIGFDNVPNVGEIFETFENKKDAEKQIIENKEKIKNKNRLDAKKSEFSVPLIIKADVLGSIEAIIKEVGKLNNDEYGFYIISNGVGDITENDLKIANTDKNSIIVGFNVKVDKKANDLNDQLNIKIMTFDIIYKLTEWLEETLEKIRPRKEIKEVSGEIKILKTFNQSKDKQVVGGKIMTGTASVGSNFTIMRRENEIGFGKIVGIEHNKSKTKEVFEGDECGMQIESKITISSGDSLQVMTTKII